MSRCFPYPPPGYTLSRASNEALIESIKLRKEREKAKAERKKEKRDKDEKKKLKKEKAKLNTFGRDAYGGKSWGDFKDGYLQKERKDDTEQLERSSITEEYGPPQNPSYSSDSTQNSNKRKRHASASNGTRVQGNTLRIRLPSQKNIKCDITDGEKQLCSPSGRREIPDTVATRAEPDKTCSTSMATASIAQPLPLRPDNELRERNSHHTLVSSQEDIHCSEQLIQPNSHHTLVSSQDMHSSEHGSKRSKKAQRVVQKYNDLIENWIPPSQQVQCSDADDQEWLFGRKHQQIQMNPDKNNGVIDEISCSTSASLWPSARYLPGADIYSLPYTVPF